MDLSSSTLKQRANEKLKNNLGYAILATLIVGTLTTAVSGGATFFDIANKLPSVVNGTMDTSVMLNINISPLSSLGGIVGLIIAGPLEVGLAAFFLNMARRYDTDLGLIFSQFRNIGNLIVFYVVRNIFIVLWSLLFIVPGIIASLGYSMAPYILAEHPEMKATDALKLSKQMMDGNKGKLFVLYLSFIGWYLLGVITFGIAFIVITPKIKAAETEFFNEVSGNNITDAQNAPFGQQAAAYTQPPFDAPQSADTTAYPTPESYTSPSSGEYHAPNETDRF